MFTTPTAKTAVDADGRKENATVNEAQTPQAFPEALSGILSDPDLLRRVGELIKSSTSTAGSAGEPTAVPAAASAPSPENATVSQNSLPDGLSRVLSDPQALEKLPAIMAALRPMLTGDAAPRTPSAHSDSNEGNRDRLLLALRPFLSPERRRAIDTILRLSKLGAVFGELK